MKKMACIIAAIAAALLSSHDVLAAEKFNDLEDAAVSQARVWQSGGKAKPIMSSDGMVIFPYGESMPKLTCSPTRACDVQMQPLEKVRKVILGDKINWTWEAADSIEKGKAVQHVVFQPRDKNVESNVIITTDHRTYHIKLYAPKTEGVYLNRVGFYYPEELVQSWEDKAGRSTDGTMVAGEQSSGGIMPIAVPATRLAFDYRVDGDADFKPVRVFNDGERVFMEMPSSLRNQVHPTFVVVDDKGKAIDESFRRVEDPQTGTVYYVVDRLFAKGQLIIDAEKVDVVWKRKEKGFFSWGNNP